MWAVVPVKQLAAAKQRLAGTLSPAARTALANAMLEDVLAALAACPRIERRSIVRGDAAFTALERRYGIEPIVEMRPGLRRALRRAARHVRKARGHTLLVVPADVPAVTGGELDTLAAGHGRMSIVPDRDDNGTNALALTPPDLLPFLYGDRSYSAHVAAAAARGVEARVLRLPGLQLDVDMPADLYELARRGTHTRAGALAAELVRELDAHRSRPHDTVGAA
jgi:2-phospho-L-lactate guanylyltransferase